MIIIERDNGKLEGIALPNFISANDDGDKVWVAFWNGEKVFRTPVNHTLQEIQHKVFIARYGKAPAKGLIV